MLFKSTRADPGDAPVATFEECVVQGMAPDGGLYCPTHLPQLEPRLIAKWISLRASPELYNTMAFDIISVFAGTSIGPHDLRSIIDQAAKSFRAEHWCAIKDLPQTDGSCLRSLELFHGPTFSFKDYSIMILGGLLNHFLKKRGKKGTVLVATSGDTGSAAIAGLAQQDNLRCVVLLPKGRVSRIQQCMMTTVNMPDRVRSILVDGNFDDCQRLLKGAFADRDFVNRVQLMAVNSVNFGRIVCQMVYYIYSVIVFAPNHSAKTSICVPTGNFGNILAAWYAKQMGAPIDRLIIASNRNDILPRFYQNGKYKLLPVVPTITPSIDIALSSNFERLVQTYIKKSTSEIYTRLANEGEFDVDKNCLDAFHNEFEAESVLEKETLECMAKMYQYHQYIIDPHTAVGFAAAERHRQKNPASNVLVVSTAHPAKFPDAVIRAIGQDILTLPPEIEALLSKPEFFVEIPVDLSVLMQTIESTFAFN
eukprot:Blabericola_migrator_1__632@NODE_1158_length_5254_cov_72_579719_g788_i0_p1_GENE_NODE_1158_length_5254_cov_72_579719_g788_i0NODE_1158_length_5254_cov_72_579719_g788_i0_p1_ORF_typecomplete_len479_score67_42PALP/PF00291_25/2_1e50Thr_synth_N/PF14821_6/8_2e18Thr_synth_N/PF14821_6/9_6e03Med23/PF11573_8/0_78Med23/PF11573_8/1_1e02_NODE_1158_length_5254_cov_72_579719_g788_i025924028